MRRDTAAISRLLLDNYVIVSGRSTQRRGRDSAMTMWATAIRDSTMSYVRSPRTVFVNEGWGLAEESGNWTGIVTAADGVARSSGVYTAKWQRATSGEWRLQAEVFTTLACAGGRLGCVPPDPVSGSSLPSADKRRL
jgi:ketosteroid isomerase-like protein